VVLDEVNERSSRDTDIVEMAVQLLADRMDRDYVIPNLPSERGGAPCAKDETSVTTGGRCRTAE
jgi:hypothetical protein